MLVLLAALALTQEAAAPGLDDARELLQKGSYAEALEKYNAALKAKPKDPAAALGKARCLAAEGKLVEADAALANQPVAALLAERAALRLRRGDPTGALVHAEAALQADPKHWGARLQRALALFPAGKDKEAEADLMALIARYNGDQPNDADTLIVVARAALEFVQRHPEMDQFEFILNDLLGDAAKADALSWEARWRSGALLVSKHNKAQGIPDLLAALKINAQASEVLVELARADLQSYDLKAARAHAKDALEIDPQSVGALCALAECDIFDEQTPSALPWLDQALKANPNSAAALARLAAVRALSGQRFEDLEERAAKAHAKPAEFHADLAEQLERRRVFALAETHFRKAIALAPWHGPARNGLGMLLMRVGREDDARKEFAAARAADPYHQRVLNFVKVLKHMEKYKSIKGPHYEVIVSPGKDEVLGQYMLEHLEAMHPVLVQRFGYEPKETTKIEILVDHQWFSGRVVGVPSVGTIGACTGKVVALASPTSLKQRVNWARVLTHEVAHIITLGQTDFRIPHWYTEALAVLSEDSQRPEPWNDLLLDRVPKGELLNLDTINAAFIRPKTPDDWQMAYCQSLLYAQYMLERFGKDSLAKLLAAYADKLETEPALKRCFNVTKADFEAGYTAYLKKTVAEMPLWKGRKAIAYAAAERAVKANPNDADAAAALAENLRVRKTPERARELAEAALKLKPNHPGALTTLAKMELSIGKVDDAIKTLQPGLDPKNPDPAALELLADLQLRKQDYPAALTLLEDARKRDPLRGKWPARVVEVLLKQQAAGGKPDPAIMKSALEQTAKIDVDNLGVRRRLAELALQEGKFADAAKWSREALHIDALNPVHQALSGKAKLGLKDFAGAGTEFDRAMKDAAQKPLLLVPAAEAALGAGNLPKARQLLRERLAADPKDEAAKALLKKAAGGDQP